VRNRLGFRKEIDRDATVMRCPICDREFRPEASTALPFCSQRCRVIDLGRWLDEKQGIPFEPTEREEREPRPDNENR
jgi:uncharacterized protein